RDGVAPVRAVERDFGDWAFVFEQQSGVAHLLSLVHERRVGIVRADLIRQFYDFFEMEASLFRTVAGKAQRGEHVFARDIAYEFVSRERAVAESGKRAIEAAAAGVVRSEDFVGRAHGGAVEVYADFHSGDVRAGSAKDFRDGFRRSGA